jgi:hypothetical protein
VRNNYEVFHTNDYDASLTDFGKRIQLVSGVRPAGLQNESLNVNLPAGFYFLRLRAGHEVSTVKVVIQ